MRAASPRTGAQHSCAVHSMIPARPDPAFEPHQDAPAVASVLRDLRRNLAAGVRAAVFGRVRFDDIGCTAGQAVALVLIVLAVQLALALLREGMPGALQPEALPRVLVFVPLVLLCGCLIAWREREPRLAVAVLILFCALGVPYDFAFGFLDYTTGMEWLGPPEQWGLADALWYALYALWLAATVVGIARLAGAGPVRAAQHAAIFGLVVAAPLWWLPAADLWRSSDVEETDSHDWYALSREETFYAQPQLLERALRQLRPERPGVEDLYFVGVAGYAAEDVFMREMGVVRDLFLRRFDGAGRVVTLVNSPSTVDELPVASATSLARTLNAVGRTMNPKEDVLFLYITSHGSEEHRLAMQFWPLQLYDIDPVMLKHMLDESGIKWRVIAISACYSGGFIDELKDRYSMIVTASDASHSSFGCGNASDFTYFARAYFDEALRTTYSFPLAFEQARSSILARERAEGQTPSNPQLYVGAAAAEKLQQLSVRMAKLGNTVRVRSPRPSGGRDSDRRSCADCGTSPVDAKGAEDKQEGRIQGGALQTGMDAR